MLLRFGHPVRALHSSAVTILGKDRLPDVWPGQIVGEKFVNDHRNVIENISSVDPLMVVCRR